MFVNERVAFETFMKKTLPSKGFVVKMKSERNKGRHLLVEAKSKDSDVYRYFYVIFKHEFLHSFNFLFKDFLKVHPELSGYGESINTDCAEYARRRDAAIVFIHEDESMYSILADTLINICSRNGLRRFQDRENFYDLKNFKKDRVAVSEETFIIPLKLLERFN